MITGRIENCQPSKSGKTLRCQIGDKWYSTKNWELQNQVGTAITFEPSISSFEGNAIAWINEYQIAPAMPQTADQAFAQAYQQPAQVPLTASAPPMSVAPEFTAPAHKNRDASIVAQTLTKICSAPGDDPSVVWKRYTEFYQRYLAWDGKPVAKPVIETKAPADEFDDDIPF